MPNVDTERKRKKEEYEWLKAHHICVNCRSEDARSGRVLCWRCAVEKSEREKANRKPDSEAHQQYLRQRRQINRQNGVCISCGTRKAKAGHSECERCLAKARIRSENKRRANGITPVYLLGKNGECRYCKAPEGKHSGLCDACYQRLHAQMLHARSCRQTENYFEKNIRARK